MTNKKMFTFLMISVAVLIVTDFLFLADPRVGFLKAIAGGLAFSVGGIAGAIIWGGIIWGVLRLIHGEQNAPIFKSVFAYTVLILSCTLSALEVSKFIFIALN